MGRCENFFRVSCGHWDLGSFGLMETRFNQNSRKISEFMSKLPRVLSAKVVLSRKKSEFMSEFPRVFSAKVVLSRKELRVAPVKCESEVYLENDIGFRVAAEERDEPASFVVEGVGYAFGALHAGSW